jgi:hypothetical protein
MKKNYGVLGQIMALIISVAVIMSALLFTDIKLLTGIFEEQYDQALQMVDDEEKIETAMLISHRDEKINLVATIMVMTAPDLIWAFDLVALELFAKTYTQDEDINTVTFLGENGEFIAGDKQPTGKKTVVQEMIREGEKLGTITIGS